MKHELFEYQQQGVVFLTERKKAILADQPGLGKTIQAITAANNLGRYTLVICPASLKTNWAREIIARDAEARIQIIGSGSKVEEYSDGDGSGGEWLIINYDLLAKYTREDLRILVPYQTLILDEAHYIKETKTIRTKAALLIAELADNVFLLTGTPILNRPIELYPLLKAIGHPIAADWYSYAMKYCGAFKQSAVRWVRVNGKPQRKAFYFLNVGGATNLPELGEKIKSVYLRRTKKELKNLPEKISNEVIVSLSPAHIKKYNSAWSTYLAYLDSMKDELLEELGSQDEFDVKMEKVVSAKHLVELQKFRQITSEAKIERVVSDALRMIENEEKVIIFTVYTATLESLVAAFNKEKIKCVSLSGENDATERQQAVDQFQNDESVKAFIGNIKAAGVGLTLTAATQVLFVDCEWTPALNEQAEDRAHRVGQSEVVNIYYYLAENTIDEDVQVALEKKKALIASVLAGDRQRLKAQSIGKELLKGITSRGQRIHR